MIVSSNTLHGYRVGIAALVLLFATLLPQFGLAGANANANAILLEGSVWSEGASMSRHAPTSRHADQDGAPGDLSVSQRHWQMRARDVALVEDIAGPSAAVTLFVVQDHATRRVPDPLRAEPRQRAALARHLASAIRLPARPLTGLHAMRAQAPPARA